MARNRRAGTVSKTVQLLVLSWVLLVLPTRASSQCSNSDDWFLELDPRWVVTSSPALAPDGTIYVGSMHGPPGAITGALWAINPDGTVQWIFPTEDAASGWGAPAIGDDGTIYVPAGRIFHAVNPDGSPKWSTAADLGIFFGSPAIARDGTVYMGSNRRTLFAFDPDDGTVKWQYVPGSRAPGELYNPVIGRVGTIYFGLEDDFFMVNPDGTYKGAIALGPAPATTVASSAAIGPDNIIYFNMNDSYLYALTPTNLSPKWVFQRTDSTHAGSSPVLGEDGTLYVGSWDRLFGVNPMDGTQAKEIAIFGAVVLGSPAAADNGLLFLGDSQPGSIYAIDPLAWHANTLLTSNGHADASSPVINDDGMMYKGAGTKLFALCTASTGLANSAWPMFRHDPARTARANLHPMAIFILKKMVLQVKAFHAGGAAESSLASQLTSAIEALEREQQKAALGKLGAFVKHVRAQSGKKIAPEDARALLSGAQRVIDSLDGRDRSDRGVRVR